MRDQSRLHSLLETLASIAIGFCVSLGIKCIGVSPGGKGAKLDAAAFNRLTGWRGASNQHTQAAGAVAWPYRKFTPKMDKEL